MSAPAFEANSVSPRVSDTTMPPHVPLRTRACRNAPRSALSAFADAGVVWRSGGGAGLRAVGRRVVARAGRRAAGRALVGDLAFGLDELAPPFWASAAGAPENARLAARIVAPRRRAPNRVPSKEFTMSDVATGVPGTQYGLGHPQGTAQAVAIP